MFTAILSFVGVVIGASLQYFFTRHIENQKHIRDLRSNAYMDYLRTASELANYRPKENSKERIDILARTADAKSRVCLYGSNTVIKAFSKFERLGATMGTAEQRDAFTDMVKEMRNDSGGEMGADSTDLQAVLLGSKG